MPYALVHLAIARQAEAPQEPSPAYLLGCLAPDAIHARPGADRALKRHTHLLDRPGQWPAPLQAWLADLGPLADAQRHLVRGYATHLLSDRLWAATVVAEFRAQVPPDLGEADLARLYYAEMDLLEGALYRALPWRGEIVSALAAAPLAAIPGLISARELDEWREITLRRWGEMAARPATPLRYASEARLWAYVAEAAALVRQAAQAWPQW